MVLIFLVLDCVGIETQHIISPWETYPSCTWEALRRVDSYRKYYKSLKNIDIKSREIAPDIWLYSSDTDYPEIERYGLLFPVDPELYAYEAPVFWHPNRFKSAVRFHQIPEEKVRPESTPIMLSDYPAKRSYFRSAKGVLHVRLLGPRFWFQLHCDDIKLSDEQVYIGLDFNHAEGRDKRLQTASQLFGMFDGSLPLDSPIHRPKRSDLHRLSALVYDIRKAGGPWKEAMSAVFGDEIIEKNIDEIESYRTKVRNYERRAKSHINGDYLQILDQT